MLRILDVIVQTAIAMFATSLPRCVPYGKHIVMRLMEIQSGASCVKMYERMEESLYQLLLLLLLGDS